MYMFVHACFQILPDLAIDLYWAGHWAELSALVITLGQSVFASKQSKKFSWNCDRKRIAVLYRLISQPVQPTLYSEWCKANLESSKHNRILSQGTSLVLFLAFALTFSDHNSRRCATQSNTVCTIQSLIVLQYTVLCCTVRYCTVCLVYCTVLYMLLLLGTLRMRSLAHTRYCWINFTNSFLPDSTKLILK